VRPIVARRRSDDRKLDVVAEVDAAPEHRRCVFEGHSVGDAIRCVRGHARIVKAARLGEAFEAA
jgi:hypothetical protein